MCSWFDDITVYHSEETDDWYVNGSNLKDPKGHDHCWPDCAGDHRDFTVAAQ